MRAKRATKTVKVKHAKPGSGIVIGVAGDRVLTKADVRAACLEALNEYFYEAEKKVGDPLEQPGTIQTAPPLENMAARGPKIPHLPWITSMTTTQSSGL